MKNLLLIALSFMSYAAFAQNSITVEAHETNVDPTCCTTIAGDIGTEITVNNVSSSSLEIKVSREVIFETPETKNYFCWTQCYGPNTSVSPSPIIFAPQQVDPTSFQVHFDNLGVSSASATIRYCAFDANNPADSACTIVYYAGPTSVQDDFNTSYFSDFHPNPTASTAFLDYDLKAGEQAEVVVSDILGNVVIQQIIENESGTLKFDVSNTKAGLYFANIFVNGEVKTMKRLVVGQ